MSAEPRSLNAVVIADAQNIVVRAYDAFAVLRPIGRPIFIGGSMGGWVLDRTKRGHDRLGDVMAVLEHARYKVRLEVEEPALRAEGDHRDGHRDVDHPDIVELPQAGLW